MSTTIEDLSIKRCLGLLILSTALVLIPSIITSKRVTVSVPNPSIALGRLEPTAEATSLEDMLVDKPKVEPEPVIAPVAVIEPPQAVVVPEPPVTPKPVQKPVTKPPVASQTYNEPMEDAKAYIYRKESSNNPSAVNASSGACGLGQALPCKKMSLVCPDWQTDYTCQDRWFEGYMRSRYGTWETARQWHLNHNWW